MSIEMSAVREDISVVRVSISPTGRYLALLFLCCRLKNPDSITAQDCNLHFLVIDLPEEKIIYQNHSFIIGIIKWSHIKDSLYCIGRLDDEEGIYEISFPENTISLKDASYSIDNFQWQYSPDEKIVIWVESKSYDASKEKKPIKTLSYKLNRVVCSVSDRIIKKMIDTFGIIFPSTLTWLDKIQDIGEELNLNIKINDNTKQVKIGEKAYHWRMVYNWLDNEHIVFCKDAHIVIYNVCNDSSEEIPFGDNREILQYLISPDKIFILFSEQSDFSHKCCYVNRLDHKVHSTDCNNISELIGCADFDLYFEKYHDNTVKICKYNIESREEEILLEDNISLSSMLFEHTLYYLKEFGESISLCSIDNSKKKHKILEWKPKTEFFGS